MTSLLFEQYQQSVKSLLDDSGYDKGEKFQSIQEVEFYFSDKNYNFLFGETLTQLEYQACINEVIRHKLHFSKKLKENLNV